MDLVQQSSFSSDYQAPVRILGLICLSAAACWVFFVVVVVLNLVFLSVLSNYSAVVLGLTVPPHPLPPFNTSSFFPYKSGEK